MTELALSLAFYTVAAVTAVSALLVVTLRNLLHAVLFLVLTFFGMAALYITLNAEFLAGVQVLIYAGAIAVLMIFAIMMTRNAMTQGNLPNRMQGAALLVALSTFVVMTSVLLSTQWGLLSQAQVPTSADLYDALFTVYVLPFEVASILLLVAMIGAIVLAKD
ncbi:MAG: NADH-quinone oxidoreductase subunit J [Chloroflexi bacterium]|nr:NADH-quinone oxidoreductase subunit J [Chloroflexota bacterium]